MSMKSKAFAMQQSRQPISFHPRILPDGWNRSILQYWKKKKTCMQLNNVGMKDIDTNHLNRKVKEPKTMTRLWNAVSVIGLLTCLVLALWAYKSGSGLGRNLAGIYREVWLRWNGGLCPCSDYSSGGTNTSGRNQLSWRRYLFWSMAWLPL